MTRAERRAKRELEREFRNYVLAPEPPRSRWWAALRPVLLACFARRGAIVRVSGDSEDKLTDAPEHWFDYIERLVVCYVSPVASFAVLIWWAL